MSKRPQTAIYPFETWLFDDKYPSKEYVLSTIRKWTVYSHGIRMNKVILKGGKPAYKIVDIFYLPREIDALVEALAEMSMLGYRVYAISNDTLSGIYFDLDAGHQTDIDADLIQAIMDYAKKVSETSFISEDVIGNFQDGVHS